MDLGADLFRTRGRASKAIDAELARELVPADLAALSEEKGSVPSPLKRLSERHHALARGISTGMDHKQASAIYGYSESRISILLSDPAFQELVSFYRAEDTQQVRDLGVKLAEAAATATDLILDRLEDEPDKFSIGQLMEVTKLGADRTGFGPQSSSTQVNINVDMAAKLQAARMRVAERKAGTQEILP